PRRGHAVGVAVGRGLTPVPLALVVRVSPRLPGLLTAAGWRAVEGGPVAALPGAAATAAALRRDGVEVTDVPDAAAAAALPGEVVCLAGPDDDGGGAPEL